MTSKAKLTEVIRRRLADGNPTVNDKVQNAEIHRGIAAAANKLLKIETLGNFSSEGDTLIDGVLIANYEALPVERYTSGKCRVALPARPMVLPDRMGVFSVYPSGYPEREFIPMPVGTYNLFMGVKSLSTIGRTVYSYEGRHLIIHKDIIGQGTLTVDLKLAIADIDLIDEHEPLPLPPEMEADVVAYVVNLYITKENDSQ